MRANQLIYGLVLAALGGAAFRYLPYEETVTPRAHSAIAEVRPENDRRPRLDHFGHVDPPGTGGPDRMADSGAIELFIPAGGIPTVPLSDQDFAIEPARGSDLERRIRERFGHPDPEERIAALQAVYALDDEDAVRFLQEVILREKNGSVYQTAVTVLAAVAGEGAVAAVTTAIGDQDATLRSQAVEALGRVGPHGLGFLGRVLLGDPEPELRQRALQLLAANGSPAAMALLEAVVDDADLEISQAAKDALRSQSGIHGRRTTAEASDALYLGYKGLPDDFGNPVFRLTGGSHPDERIEAIQDLHVLDAEDAARTLKVVLKRDEHRSVREEALFALENIGGKTAISAISVALGDDSPELRQRAMEALWRSGGSDALPPLGQVLHGDPDPGLRLEAVRLLGSEDGPAVRALLVAASEDPDHRVRLAAQRLLGR